VSDRYDVFLSYCAADSALAERLAYGLHTAGLTVFIDQWEILAGDVIVARTDQGIQSSDNAVVVVSRHSSQSGGVTDEYAALAKQANDGRLRRLVPVLADDEVALPPMLASRARFSFADVVDEPTFRALANRLAAELRGESRRGTVDDLMELDLVVPQDRLRTRGTPLWATVRIDGSLTTLVGDHR